MKVKTLKMTQTAILLALLIALQAGTASFGQLITGSCVNMVLCVAALTVSGWYAAFIALISPFLAFILGVGPKLFPIVPVIAIGNLIYVLIIGCGAKASKDNRGKKAGSIVLGAATKFVWLYVTVVKVLCSVLTLKDAQIKTFSVMFSYPQLLTAIIGGAVGMIVAKILSKQFNKTA